MFPLLIYMLCVCVYCQHTEQQQQSHRMFVIKTCKISRDVVYGGNLTDCSNLDITNLPLFDLPQNTSTLILDYNNIGCLRNRSFHTAKLRSLRHLSIQSSRVSAIEVDALLGLRSLDILNLEGNNLPICQKQGRSFPAGMFKHVPNLRYLFIGFNEEMQELVPECQIYPDHIDIFSTLPHLTNLSIDTINDTLYLGQEFSNLTRLTNLSVACRNVRHIYNNSLQGLMSLQIRVLKLFNFKYEILIFELGIFQNLPHLMFLSVTECHVGNHNMLLALKPLANRNMTSLFLKQTNVYTDFNAPSFVFQDGIILHNLSLSLTSICVPHMFWVDSTLFAVEPNTIASETWRKCLRTLDASNNMLENTAWLKVILEFRKLKYLSEVSLSSVSSPESSQYPKLVNYTLSCDNIEEGKCQITHFNNNLNSETISSNQMQPESSKHVQTQSGVSSQIQTQTRATNDVKMQPLLNSQIQAQQESRSQMKTQIETNSKIKIKPLRNSQIQKQPLRNSYIERQQLRNSQIQTQSEFSSHTQPESNSQIQTQLESRSQIQTQTESRNESYTNNTNIEIMSNWKNNSYHRTNYHDTHTLSNLSVTTLTMNQLIKSNFLYKGNITYYFPPSLKKVIFIDMIVGPVTIYNWTLVCKSCSKFEELYWINNYLLTVKGVIYGVENLKVLDVTGSMLNIADHLLDTFYGLQVFVFSGVKPETIFKTLSIQRLIRNLTNLRYLDVSNNKLNSDTFPATTFTSSPNVTHLILSKNRFSNIPFDLTTTPKLQVLDLSENAILFLTQEEMENLNNHAALVDHFLLLLHDNGIACVCSKIDFFVWRFTTRVRVYYSKTKMCWTDDGQSVRLRELSDIPTYSRLCQGRIFLMISLVLASLMSAAFLLAYLFARFRTSIEAFLRAIFGKRIGPMKPEDYKIGVFIGYADDDYRFVRNKLRTYLEEVLKLNTFIHQRDLLQGPIDQQFIDAIRNSWRVILVLSRTFLNHYDLADITMKYASHSVTTVNQGRVFVLVEESQVYAIPDYLHDVLDDTKIVVLQDLHNHLNYEQKQSIKHCLRPVH